MATLRNRNNKWHVSSMASGTTFDTGIQRLFRGAKWKSNELPWIVC